MSKTRREKVPARMSFEDCAARAARAIARGRRKQRMLDDLIQGNAGQEYQGAAFHRLTMDWVTNPLSADDEVHRNIRVLRMRARDLCRNSGYAKRFLSVLSSSVIGPAGMKLQSEPRSGPGGQVDEATSEAIETAWRDWSEGPVTIDGRMSLLQLEHMGLRTVGRDGEFLARMLRFTGRNEFGLELQPLDPDLIDEEHSIAKGTNQPEIRMGVEIDEWGTPGAYWVLEDVYRSPAMTTTRSRYRVPADEMLHLFVSDRPGMTRGLSWFAPALYNHRMLMGLQESVLVNQRAAASNMAFITSAEGPPMSADGNPADQSQVFLDAAPGTLHRLAPGEKIEPWKTDQPADNYADFVKTILRDNASALFMDYPTFANDYEGVNLSSIRAGRLTTNDMWKIFQAWWAFDFRRRVFVNWLEAALITGRLKLKSFDASAYKAHSWIPRGFELTEPLKEVQADVLAIQNGLTSRKRVIARNTGEEYQDIVKELGQESVQAEEVGVNVSGMPPVAEPADDDDGDEKAPPKKNGKARRFDANGGAVVRWNP